MQNKIIAMFQKIFVYMITQRYLRLFSPVRFFRYMYKMKIFNGEASKWWLHHAVIDVKKQLEALGSTLIIRKGRTEEEILSLIEQLDITAVYWNICYDPDRLQSNQK